MKLKKEVALNIITIVIIILLILIIFDNQSSKSKQIVNDSAPCIELSYEERFDDYLDQAIAQNDFRLCDGLKNTIAPDNLNPVIECYYEFAALKRRAEICGLPESKDYVIKDDKLLVDGETYTQLDTKGSDKCYLMVISRNAYDADFINQSIDFNCNKITYAPDKESCFKYKA